MFLLRFPLELPPQTSNLALLTECMKGKKKIYIYIYIYLNHWKELLVELKIMIFKELVETGSKDSKPFIHQSLESKNLCDQI